MPWPRTSAGPAHSAPPAQISLPAHHPADDVTTNLRISLTILSVGFAIEGIGEAYSAVSHRSLLPSSSLLLVLPTAITFVGLLFVWIGRHEWNELHRTRVRNAHQVFGMSLLGGAFAGATAGALFVDPGLGFPDWAYLVFGLGVGVLVMGTFVTYAILVFHLIGNASRIVLAAALAWAFVVAAFLGATLARALPAIVALLRSPTTAAASLLGPVDVIESYLFVSYFLLLAVYLEAHRRVARGLAAAAVGSEGTRRPS